MLLACGDKEQAEDSGLEATEFIEPKVQEQEEIEPSEPEDTSSEETEEETEDTSSEESEEETEEDTGGEA